MQRVRETLGANDEGGRITSAHAESTLAERTAGLG